MPGKQYLDILLFSGLKCWKKQFRWVRCHSEYELNVLLTCCHSPRHIRWHEILHMRHLLESSCTGVKIRSTRQFNRMSRVTYGQNMMTSDRPWWPTDRPWWRFTFFIDFAQKMSARRQSLSKFSGQKRPFKFWTQLLSLVHYVYSVDMGLSKAVFHVLSMWFQQNL
jgi:hypothetical protein